MSPTKVGDLFVDLHLNSAGFDKQLTAALARAQGDLAIKLKIDADTSLAEAKIARLARTQRAIIHVDADTSAATAKINKSRGGSASVRVDADTSAAETEINRAARNRTSEIRVKADTKQASAAIDSFSGRLGILSAAITAIGPATIPVLAATGGALGALGSGLTAAAGAGGAFAISIVGQVSAMKEQQQAITSAQKALDKLKPGTEAYKTKLQELTALQRTFNQQFGPAATGFHNLTKAYSDYQKATSKTSINVVAKSLNLVADVLPKLVPLSNAAGKAVGGLIDDLSKFSKTNQFQGILDFFQKQGPPAITAFGHIAGNTLLGVINVFKAFAPTQQKFLDFLEQGSKKFADFTGNLGKNKGFQNFLAYVNKVAPKVGETLKDVAGAIGKVVQALAPQGSTALSLIDGLAKSVSKLKPGEIAAIAGAVGALGLATGKFSKLNSLALLVSAISYAYSHSDAFRTLADGARQLADALNSLPKSIKIGGLAALAGIFLGGKAVKAFGGIGKGGGILGSKGVQPVFVTNWPGALLGAGAAGGKKGGKIGNLFKLGGAAVGSVVGLPELIAGAVFTGIGLGASKFAHSIEKSRPELGKFGTPKNQLLSEPGSFTPPNISATGKKQLKELADQLNKFKNKVITIDTQIRNGDVADKLFEKLNGLKDKTVQIIAKVADSGPIEKLKNFIGQLKDKVVKVAANVANINPIQKLKDLVVGLKDKAVKVAVNVANSGPVQKLKDFIGGLKDKAVKVAVTVANSAPVQKLKDFIGSLKDKAVKVAVSIANGKAVQKLKDFIGSLKDKAVKVAVKVANSAPVQKLKEAINGLKNKAIKVAATVAGSGPVKTLTNVVKALKGKTVKAIATATGSGPVKALTNTVKALTGKTVKAVANAIGRSNVQALINTVRSLAGKTVKAVANAIGQSAVQSLIGTIRSLTGKTVKVLANVSGTSAVQGLISAISAVKSKTVSIISRATTIVSKIFKASGGAVYGQGTGTSDEIPAMLSNGEHVWTAKEVQKAGGQGAMYAMRQAVMSGALTFAGGGAITKVPVRFRSPLQRLGFSIDRKNTAKPSKHILDDGIDADRVSAPLETFMRRSTWQLYNGALYAEGSKALATAQKLATDAKARTTNRQQTLFDETIQKYANQAAAGDISGFDREIAKLRLAQSHVQPWSDRWVELRKQIQDVTKEKGAALQALKDNQTQYDFNKTMNALNRQAEAGDLSAYDKEIAMVLAAQKKVKAWSDQWVQYQEQIDALSQTKADAQQHLADNMRDYFFNQAFNNADSAGQISLLQSRLNGLIKYSDEWMSMMNQIMDLQKQMADAAAAAAQAIADARAEIGQALRGDFFHDDFTKQFTNGADFRSILGGLIDQARAFKELGGISANTFDYLTTFAQRYALVLEDVQKQLDANATAQEAANSALDDAKSKLESAQSAYDSLKNSVKDSVSALGQFADASQAAAANEAEQVYQATLAKYGANSANTMEAARRRDAASIKPGAIVADLTTRLAQVRDFAANIQTLRQMGLGSAAIQQILALGPIDGAVYAQALTKALPSDISSINHLETEFDSIGTGFGLTMANAFESVNVQAAQSGVDVAQGILDGLKSQEQSLLEYMTTLAQRIVASFENSLGIHSPSRVFHEVGVNALLGLQNGLTSQVPNTLGKLNDLADSLMAITAPKTTTASPAQAPLPVPAASVSNGPAVTIGSINVQDNVTAQGLVQKLNFWARQNGRTR